MGTFVIVIITVALILSAIVVEIAMKEQKEYEEFSITEMKKDIESATDG